MKLVKELTYIELQELINKETVVIEDFKYKFCDYKSDNVVPNVDDSWQSLPEF